MQLFKYLLQIHFSPFLPASGINTFVSSVSVDIVRMLLKACIINMQHKGYVYLHSIMHYQLWHYPHSFITNKLVLPCKCKCRLGKKLQTGDVTEIGADFPALNCSYHHVVKEEEYWCQEAPHTTDRKKINALTFSSSLSPLSLSLLFIFPRFGFNALCCF